MSSTRKISPACHDLVSFPAATSPRPDNTNIHCRAGTGCAESVQPAGRRMNSTSRADVAGETSRGGAGGAKTSLENEISPSSNPDIPFSVFRILV